MALTAQQRCQRARSEADLRREDPDVARALALLRPRASSRRSPGFAALGQLAVNVIGVVSNPPTGSPTRPPSSPKHGRTYDSLRGRISR